MSYFYLESSLTRGTLPARTILPFTLLSKLVATCKCHGVEKELLGH
jgi:hypothetical protein